MPKVGLILLAAGQGSRMGVPKQLLEYQGRSLLLRAVNSALASVCEPVLVVIGAYARELSLSLAGMPVTLINNPDWQHGLGTSIRAGINAMQHHDVDAALLSLTDQPMLTFQTYDRLVAAYAQQRLPVTAAEYAGILGTPALFDRSLFPQLLQLPSAQGCKQLINNTADELIARCACPEAELDIDTPADYSRLLTR